jgi:hypothetical protein
MVYFPTPAHVAALGGLQKICCQPEHLGCDLADALPHSCLTTPQVQGQDGCQLDVALFSDAFTVA